MSFARPWLLLLLLVLPLWWLLRRRRGVPAARYSDVSLPAMATRRRWWVVLPPVLRGLALGALVLTAAGPRFGGDTVEIKQEGIAIVITIDISSSMPNSAVSTMAPATPSRKEPLNAMSQAAMNAPIM